MNCSNLCLRCSLPQVQKANFCGFHGLCADHYVESSICKCIHCNSVVPVLSKSLEKKCCICDKAFKIKESLCGHDICKDCLELELVCPLCVDRCDYCGEKHKFYKKCDFPHILCRNCLPENDKICKICEEFAKVNISFKNCEYCLEVSSTITSSCEHTLCEDCILEHKHCPFCIRKSKSLSPLEAEKPATQAILEQEAHQSIKLEQQCEIESFELINESKESINETGRHNVRKNDSTQDLESSDLSEEILLVEQINPLKKIKKGLDDNYLHENYSVPLGQILDPQYLPSGSYIKLHNRMKPSEHLIGLDSTIHEAYIEESENEDFNSIWWLIRFALTLLNFCILKPICFCLKIISYCNKLYCFFRNPDKGGYYFYCIFLCKRYPRIRKYWISIINSNSSSQYEKGTV